MDEILAIQKVEKLKNSGVVYQARHSEYDGYTGYLELVFDENCCGASCNVSFALITKNQRILLSAKEVLQNIKLGNSSVS